MSLAFQDASIAEVMDIISRRDRVNIVLGKGVSGNVSLSLYDVSVEEAVRAVAEAAGYVVEMRGGDYLILDRKEAGQDQPNGATVLRSFKVQYSDPKIVADILAKHMSRYGKITPLLERRVLVVEERPEFMARFEHLLREVDAAPRQILIEAKILEITLDRTESFGFDWSRIVGGSKGISFGTQGLATPTSPGLFFSVLNRNLELFLNALDTKGRVHTLSTPKLLALENQEASVIIGDRIGYKVTTTINQVTTESVQFLETGVILRVTPSVDAAGRVLMKIHPEVSSGSIAAGVPSKKSIEVTTQLLADSGQAILIGGLIKNTSSYKRNGVPVLGDLPGVGRLFSSDEDLSLSTETVVVITPQILQSAAQSLDPVQMEKYGEAEARHLKMTTQIESLLKD